MLFKKRAAASPGLAAQFAGRVVARTEFRVVREFPAALLIKARPRTGRRHQIRVQLPESRMPILGDITYGPRVKAAARGGLQEVTRFLYDAPRPGALSLGVHRTEVHV